MELNKYIDHTLLKADAKKEDILKLCEEAKKYDFMSVCVNPCWIPVVKEALKQTDVLTCVVIGFPLGAMTTEAKVFEAKDAVKKAIQNPRKIDMDLTDAQQARRVLDRIVGYKISPVLWKKVQKGLSAGRVQSVAVKLVVDREEEIEKFVPEEYWNIYATLATKKPKKSFEAKFYGKNDKKLDIHSKEEIDKILDELEKAKYVVSEIKKGEKKKTPAPPFTTSTMQQEASRKLNFALRKTMQVAQRII